MSVTGYEELEEIDGRVDGTKVVDEVIQLLALHQSSEIVCIIILLNYH